eukprot:5539322-Pyramimonas_sp.AAC.1
MLLLRLLREKLATADELLNNWGKFLPEYMAVWELDRADMVERFGVYAASREYTRSGHRSQKGRKNVLVAGTTRRRGERIYP